MSLILEALRKSEAERLRDGVPNVFTELPPAPAQSTTPVVRPLAVIVAIGLLVLMAVIGLYWKRSAPLPKAVPVTPHQSDVAKYVPVQPPRIISNLPQTQAPAPPPPPPPATTPRIVETPPHTPSTPIIPTAPLPTAADPPDIGNTTLPPIKLSMHMWDPTPSRRFVILNGQRMNEGDHLDELEVISIDRKGVTIQRDGQRAHLSLPSLQ